MSKAKTKEYETLLKKVGEMVDETGCVPGIDGEEALGRLVPDAKEYIAERRPRSTVRSGDIG
jgi:hypothetical protein